MRSQVPNGAWRSSIMVEEKRSKAKSADLSAKDSAKEEASGKGGKEDQPKADEPKAQKRDQAKLSKKAQDILESVGEMSVLELNELVKALEEKFGVSAAAMVAPAAAPAAGEAAGAEEEKSEYNVVLAATGENKVSAIKAVREIKPDLGLKEAKDLVESAPKPVLEGAKKEEAEEAKKKLEDAGCKVELK
jgi:large subunit ribosomal protein L7/L12